MKYVIYLFVLLSSLSLSAAHAGGKPVPITEPKISLPALPGKTQTATDMHDYIKLAAARVRSGSLLLGMRIDADEPGTLTITFNKQSKHYFTLSIPYTADSYELNYVSSVDLDYTELNGERMIHRNYPVWINELITNIAEIQSLSARVQ